jgi:predicted ATPase/GAF domain-containing protein/anti-anti-sigma regulatory factor
VTLLDFGIASCLSHETQPGHGPGAVEGTLAYMSPEQTGRMNRLLDTRSDLYSLGVTLYELLTYTLPFTSTDALALIHCHIARRPPTPQELNSRVPAIVSDVVMRLLAKASEDRYQTAAGLAADLRECLTQLQSKGEISDFPLGRSDFSAELRVPQRLYGRQAEQQVLSAALHRAAAGSAELVLISGYPGVGKTALVHEMYSRVVAQGGFFAEGKFDQFSSSAPMAQLVHALRDLLVQILTQREATVAQWKTALQLAVGSNGKLLTDFMPELLLIIGPQPSVAEIGPTESQNRFALLVQNFLRVFATHDHPLILFLDDLQWADAASLKLLQLVLEDAGSSHLLIIGTYRDQEIGATHPFASTLQQLRNNGRRLTELLLQPLGEEPLRLLLAETLRRSPSDVEPLAQVVLRKTQGNPFFLNQFLAMLAERRLLRVDPARQSFIWDLPAIEQQVVTDNVVEFMAEKMSRLAAASQRALQLASCIGHRFELHRLAVVSGEPPRRTAAALWEALREGFILPIGDAYRLSGADTALDAEDESDESGTASGQLAYRFVHDRVRQVAYAKLSDDQRLAAHLQLGRQALRTPAGEVADEELFEAVNHLNQASALLTDLAEREQVARLNLRAGQRAKSATAYVAASQYLQAARAQLPESCWETDYSFALQLQVAAAESAYLSAQHEQAEALFDAALGRARTDLDKAHIHTLLMNLYGTQGKFVEALRAGRAGLALLGVTFPESDDERKVAIGHEMGLMQQQLGDRPIAELVDAPLMTDPAQKAALRLLADLFVPAYFISPPLFLLAVAKQVNISLRYGTSELSDQGYMTHGYVLAAVFGQHQQGYGFGKLALALNQRFGYTDVACKLYFLFGVFNHFCEPLPSALRYFQASYEAGLRSGDFLYLSYTANHSITVRLGMGEDLVAVREQASRLLQLMQQIKSSLSVAFQTLVLQVIRCLTGETSSRQALSDATFDEAVFIQSLDPANFGQVHCVYHLYKMMLAYLNEDYAAAIDHGEQAEARVGSDGGVFFASEIPFFLALAAVALPAEGQPSERAAAALGRAEKQLQAAAQSCPPNFRHRLLLLEAERASRADQRAAAAELFDQAIDAATAQGFIRDAALAGEAAAKWYLRLGRDKLARYYMVEAHSGYLRWGATAKAAQLVSRFPALFPQTVVLPTRLRSGDRLTVTRTSSSGHLYGGLLDVAAVLRAAQAISGEIEMRKVLDQLMRIVIANAGAQKGALLLEQGGVLRLQAVITVEPDELRVGMATPLEQVAELPHSLVQLVARTRQSVALADATLDHRFSSDPYIAAQKPRSVLCLALLHQGRLSGVLYLENSVAPNVFTSERVELLGLLSSQAVIAVENALLYEHVQSVTAELRSTNERLEREVAERTEELRKTNEQLQSELVDNLRAQKERDALQAEIIRVQSARLAEMSTPLIPITDRIVVMPLIGTVDAQRAEQVLDTALEGAQKQQASVVILDITGVSTVDTAVAGTLINTARALRLLGAQTVLTGIRAEVAQTLVGLGIELGDVASRSTLQSGIAYALTVSGESRRLIGQAQDARSAASQPPGSRLPQVRRPREGR